MASKYYAGVGSRTTPLAILKIMTEFGKRASAAGLTLRSGAAKGADAAFERGCDLVGGSKEIFLPWPLYENSSSELHGDSLPAAYQLASTIHPSWSRLTPTVRKLVARNMHQINGIDFCTPVEFVVCWTRDGCESHTSYRRSTGGTGTAISAASVQAIPVYNFFHERSMLAAFDLV